MAHLTAGFLVVLVLAWAAVCLPAATRARNRAPFTSARRFKRDMRLISIPGSLELVDQDDDLPFPLSDRIRNVVGRVEIIPHGLRLRVGRTVAFAFVLALVVASFIAAVGAGAGWDLHLACDAVAALHVAWLLETKRKSSGPSNVRALVPYGGELDEFESPRLRAVSGRF